MTPDDVQLNFEPESLLLLNVFLGMIMFGVALDLKLSDFQYLFKNPKPLILGFISQFLLLPALTFLLVLILKPYPSLGLGMILVAACPGGNISNFISSLAKANVALSISLTAVATMLASVMTPLNFTFWQSFLPDSLSLSEPLVIPLWELIETIVILLGIPVILGILCRNYLPKVADFLQKPLRIFSILFFLGFLAVAFYSNFDNVLNYIGFVFFLVLIHNAVALSSGYLMGKLGRLPDASTRTLVVETGIQNSGLGLILIFNFFDGLGGMLLVALWWGMWHVVSGLSLAFVLSRFPPKTAN